MALWIRIALLELGVALMIFLVWKFFPRIMRGEKHTTANVFKWVGAVFLCIHVSGVFCNAVALIFNGGKMPISAECLEMDFARYDRNIHLCADSSTRVRFLTDRFYFRAFPNDAHSIGDVLMWTGLAGFTLFILSFFTVFSLRDWSRKNSP